MSFDSVSAFFASRSAARCATMLGLPKPAKGLSVSGTTIVDAVWPPLATCRPPDGFGADLAPFFAPKEKAAAPAARYRIVFISTMPAPRGGGWRAGAALFWGGRGGCLVRLPPAPGAARAAGKPPRGLRGGRGRTLDAPRRLELYQVS